MVQQAKALKTEMRWIAPTDLPALLTLDHDIYEKQLIGEIALYASWITKNAHSTLCIFDSYAQQCLAYISMIPLREQTILQVLRRERDELDLRADDILTFEQTGWYTLLVSSVLDAAQKSATDFPIHLHYWLAILFMNEIAQQRKTAIHPVQQIQDGSGKHARVQVRAGRPIRYALLNHVSKPVVASWTGLLNELSHTSRVALAHRAY